MREKTLYQYNFVHQKSHKDWTMIQHVPPW